MAKHAPVVEHAGNTVTVIARTAEAAMALLADSAPGYRTTSIGKVRRGGIAGFFATELVRVVAERTDGSGHVPPTTRATAEAVPTGGPASEPAPAPGPATMKLATADDLLASLCGADGPFAGRLAAGIQRSLQERPTSTPADVPGPTNPAGRAAASLATGSLPVVAAGPDAEIVADFVPPSLAAGSRGPDTTADATTRAADAVVASGAPAADLPAIAAALAAARMAADRLDPPADAVGPTGTEHVVDTIDATASPATSTPAPRQGQARTQGDAYRWSAAALEALGLPARLVDRVAAIGPHDEVTWNVALMLAVRDWCGGDLPSGAVVAGPACAPIASALHAPTIAPADLADRDGPVAVPAASATHLTRAGDRPVHLVVGGAWRHLATVAPAIVSAADAEALVDAVRVAVAWDAPLGWTMRNDALVRIDPFLLADHLRAALDPSVAPSIPVAARKKAATRGADGATPAPRRRTKAAEGDGAPGAAKGSTSTGPAPSPFRQASLDDLPEDPTPVRRATGAASRRTRTIHAAEDVA